jgi:hypothetical protein
VEPIVKNVKCKKEETENCIKAGNSKLFIDVGLEGEIEI